MILDRILLSALKKAMAFRCDGQPQLSYFWPEEYGVSSTPFSFRSGKWTLRGNRYFVPSMSPKALVVFFHGIGAGANAYMQEICALAKQGYLVYAYDNTGCMTSEGQTVGFFPQSLLDQACFFEFLDHEEQAKGLRRFAVGHSWGGYTALGSLQKKYRVEKVVSISGFVSLKDIVLSQAKSLERLEAVLEKALRRGYGEYGALDLLNLMETTDARVLYIQGENDNLVTKQKNYDLLHQRFSNKPNISLMLVEGAMHNPYWTLEAQAYAALLGKDGFIEKGFDNSRVIDYAKLNHDDPVVMKAIFDFLATR